MRSLLAVFLTVVIAAFASGASGQAGPTQDELNAAEKSTEWMLPNHDYAGQRFVDLKQITTRNASQLRPVCMFQVGDTTSFQPNPLVYKGVLYFTASMSTIAINAATCEQVWRHDWKSKEKEGRAGFRGRGAALRDGVLVRSTSDGHLIALDAKTGKIRWEKLVANAQKNELMTMAPLTYGNLVITGIGVGEWGAVGWIGGFRLSDGEPVWRFATIPSAPGEPGWETWNCTDTAKPCAGGGVWTTPSIDTAKGLLYVPVGNPAPDFFGDIRQGSNLYTNSIVVLDAKTGNLQWYRQYSPHDLWDRDLTIVSPLYTTSVNGTQRQLVSVGGKDGLLRAVDRDTREQVYEVAVTKQLNVGAKPNAEGVYVCPGIQGGLQWSAPSYNPGLNTLVVPSVEWCGSFKKDTELRLIPGQLYLGGSSTLDPLDKSAGKLTALDAATGTVRWTYESKRPLLAQATSTSGNLVFTGELTGHFLVLDGRSGDVLYKFATGGAIISSVVTYAVEGKQYVAVPAGATAAFWPSAPAAASIIVFAVP